MESSLYRRHFIALACAAAGAGLLNFNANAAANAAAHATAPRNVRPHTLLVVGDSLSAEYGLKRGSGWVALLQARLAEEKYAASVVNASISGDTTSGGRSRLPALLAQHRPTLVIIELGANDALRGLPMQMTQDNLLAMAKAAKAAGAKVLIIGMQMPPNYGQEYGAKFAATFAAVAKDTQASLVPFLLKNVADASDAALMFQNDRIHPVEAAHPRMLNNVWPTLKKMLT